jgi:pentatricopeptide repeat protein
VLPAIAHLDTSSNAWLAQHVQAGEFKKTMELSQQMPEESMGPDIFILVQGLNACATQQFKC